MIVFGDAVQWSRTTHDRRSDPSDVDGDEWSLVVPYLVLMCEQAPQRTYPLSELLMRCAI
jgi:hypothetical protein